MGWMAWTWPSALFFAAVFLALAGMTVWELIAPSRRRRGLLPLQTSRGDRFFISLLVAAFALAGWLATTDAPAWGGAALGALLAAVVWRFG